MSQVAEDAVRSACDTNTIERVAIGFDQAGHSFHSASSSFEAGAKDLGRELAVAALNELRLLMKEFIATPEFKAARAWDNSADPAGDEPKHSDELARAIKSCREELTYCAAVPLSVRQCVGEAIGQFAQSPRAALSFAATITGAKEYIRSKGAR